jgi:hypothetical protein
MQRYLSPGVQRDTAGLKFFKVGKMPCLTISGICCLSYQWTIKMTYRVNVFSTESLVFLFLFDAQYRCWQIIQPFSCYFSIFTKNYLVCILKRHTCRYKGNMAHLRAKPDCVPNCVTALDSLRFIYILYF